MNAKNMIHHNYLFFLFISISLLFSSCVKSLEDKPLELITEDYLWDSKDSLGTNANLFLNSIYAKLPKGFNRIGNNVLDAASDDAVPTEDGASISSFTNGGYSALSNADDSWQNSYAGIRMTNLFLQNFYKVHLKRDLLLEGQYWRAENRFLRVMFYYELIKRYGGVPLLGDQVFTLSDNLDLPRNTFDECVDYIVAECDAIKDSLRIDPVATGDYGRITRGVALTLKAKVLLLAASPLNNLNNDIDKWQRAKNAAAEVIALNAFSLEPAFSNVFTTRSNKEVILAYQRALTTDLEVNNAPIGYVSGSTSSLGRTSPTQELVDAFPTIRGRAITEDVRSGSNPTGYDATNPYANRDPRLDLTVFYNGLLWLGRGVETFDGGKDRPGGAAVQTKTGYYMRKFLGNFATGTAYSNQTHNFPIFRYADVLLMFAEAKNEIDGPGSVSDSVYTYLKAIRSRAGIMPGTDNNYGLDPNLSLSAMREAIRLERRVELAFEEQRFWDVRRWKIAETVYNKPLHGIRITNNGSTLNYQVESLNIPFQFVAPRMYRYAIPYSEVIKNPNLKQNEGY